MIDWKKTKEKYGYSESDLPPTSRKLIVWHCDNQLCQAPLDVREREYEFNYARKKRAKSSGEGKVELCQRCSHNHRKGKVSTTKTHSAQTLPPEASDNLTEEKFGYKASTLSPWSREPIVLRFVDENNQESIHIVKRSQLNTNKSVVETGHYRPIAWYTKQRRSNVVVTEETKDLMKKSQNMRREREKVEKEETTKRRINELLKNKDVA
jgi:hypothetical protein